MTITLSLLILHYLSLNYKILWLKIDLSHPVPVIFWLLSINAHFAVLFNGSFPHRQCYGRYYSFLLHDCRLMHSSFFRLFIRYLFPKATIPVCLFCFYQCICRLSDSRNTNFVHYHENYTRLFFRNCYRSGEYGGDRYYAILPERRRNRLLRIDKQHRHVYRPDGRTISA